MNRTLLLIICDFLLLNLLALTRWEDAEPIKPRKAPVNAEQENVMSPKEKDRLIIMHKALEDRNKELENLASKLLIMGADTNAMAGKVGDMQKDLQIWIGNYQASQRAGQELKNRYNMLLEDLIQKKEEKTVVESENKKAQEKIALLEQQLQLTQQQLAEAGILATNALQTAGALTNRFNAVAAAASQTSKQVAGLSTNVARTGQQVAGLRTNVAGLQTNVTGIQKTTAGIQKTTTGISNNVAGIQKTTAGIRTNVAGIQKTTAGIRTNVAGLQKTTAGLSTNVATLRTNVAQVATTTAAPTARVGALQEDIRKNRPFNANTLFQHYQTNHVHLIFNAHRPGVLFDSNERVEAKTILVQHGDFLFALIHATDTPFALSSTATGWTRAHGSMKRAAQKGGTLLPLPGLKFLKADPRVIAVPFAGTQTAAKLRVQPFTLAKNPYHFPKAVVIDKEGDAFGEYRFDISPQTPGYVKMDKPFAGGIFSGAFNPSTGDLVVSETGELLGIMVNSKYCWVINDFTAASDLIFGQLNKTANANQIRTMHRALLAKPAAVR